MGRRAVLQKHRVTHLRQGFGGQAVTQRYMRWIWLVAAVVVGGLGARAWRTSEVIKASRYNMVIVEEGKVAFASVDTAERTTLVIQFPPNLSIKSRSQGQYEVGKLYALGTYDGTPGEFARIKVQGFMKTLVNGYLVGEGNDGRVKLIKNLLVAALLGQPQTSLSVADAVIMAVRVGGYDFRRVGAEELVRAGVLGQESGGYTYNEDRLQQYLGLRVLDWGIGTQGLTAVVVNESGEAGLAADVGKFLENAGLDVVAVRSGEEGREQTEVVVQNQEVQGSVQALAGAFGWTRLDIEETDEWRAQVVVKLGRDALRLF